MRFEPLPGGRSGPLGPLTRRPRILVPDVVEESDFGANPGHLRLLRYVPPGLGAGAPLVVVLHGCGQTGAGYGLGAGWFKLAAELGFAVLAPEQRAINNPRTCFNWFQPQDARRGSGEAASIRRMVAFMQERYALDSARIFITGLSAGGAMTAAMLAAYPEVFAGGAIVAGLPAGAAQNGREALEAMRAPPPLPPRALSDAVRRASAHDGPWPVVSVWHGLDDDIVHPGNADAIVSQWAGLHDIAHAQEDRMAAHQRRRWRDGSGRLVLESNVIAGLGHGTPISMGEGHGMPAPFILEAAIPSSLHIARFWGLAEPDKAVRRRPRIQIVADPVVPDAPPPPAAPPSDRPAPAIDAHADRFALLSARLGRWLRRRPWAVTGPVWQRADACARLRGGSVPAMAWKGARHARAYSRRLRCFPA